MGIYIGKSLLNGVCEGLNCLWVLREKAFLCTVGGVGHIAGVYAQGSYHIALLILLQSRGVRLKFYRVVGVVSREGGCSETEVDALVNG